MTRIDRRRFLAGSAALAGSPRSPPSSARSRRRSSSARSRRSPAPAAPTGRRCARRWSGSPSEVNAAGGVLGRQIQLVSEDDQTNPEAAVRAARKLIDVDKVAAIMGTWASAVTTAVAPLCWESQDVPHHGVGLRHHHAAPAPGLPDPHPAQHPSADRQARRVHPLARSQARVRARRADAVRGAVAEAARARSSPRAASRAGGRASSTTRTRPRSARRSTRRSGRSRT